jgi:hypothetical protein
VVVVVVVVEDELSSALNARVDVDPANRDSAQPIVNTSRSGNHGFTIIVSMRAVRWRVAVAEAGDEGLRLVI